MCNISYCHCPVPDPQIGFVGMSVLVSEGMASVELSVESSAPGYVKLSLGEGTATGQAVVFENSFLLFEIMLCCVISLAFKPL